MVLPSQLMADVRDGQGGVPSAGLPIIARLDHTGGRERLRSPISIPPPVGPAWSHLLQGGHCAVEGDRGAKGVVRGAIGGASHRDVDIGGPLVVLAALFEWKEGGEEGEGGGGGGEYMHDSGILIQTCLFANIYNVFTSF